MQTLSDVMAELHDKGSEQTRRTFIRHGAPEANLFGVKVGDLKAIAKKIKGQQELAYQLYATGNVDAMYLAGIVADGSKMTKRQLDTWANTASWYMISEYTVPGVAVESPYARELALKWIRSKKPSVATTGWSTYAGILATRPDEQLDHDEIEQLLKHVVEHIHTAPDRIRYAMNAFLISVGTYYEPLLAQAKQAAKMIGVVSVDMGETACKVPNAVEYIAKIESMGRIGKKRKTVKC